MPMRSDPFRQLERLNETMLGAAAQVARSFPLDADRRGDRFLVQMDLRAVSPVRLS